jgi:hypothetical protein
MKTTLTDRAVKAAKHDIADAVVPGLLLRCGRAAPKAMALVEPSHSAAGEHLQRRTNV